jgi:hypothetical protein
MTNVSPANEPVLHLPREGDPVKRALTIRAIARGAGALVIGLIALDLVATVVTLAIGAEVLKR